MRAFYWLVAITGGASLALAGCRAHTTLDADYLSASQSAKFLGLNGSSLVTGRAWYPMDLATDSIVSPRQVALGSGTLDFVDQTLHPLPDTPTGSISPTGEFQLQPVPAEQPMLLRIRFQVNGQSYQELKFISTDRSVVCARVDYASSLIAAKMISKSPLLYGETGLDNVDPLPFFDQGKLEVPETLLDRMLDQGSVSPALAPVVLATAHTSDGAAVFEAEAEASPSLGAAYNASATPASSFTVGIASMVPNKAPIPGLHRRDRTVFGVLNLQVALPPMSLDSVEYLLDGQAIASASDPVTNWQAQFNTWTVPNGPHFLDSVGVSAGQRRELTSSFINVENTPDFLCPGDAVAVP